MWIVNWLDGSVVLGGYDSNLVLGENYTDQLNYDKDEGCFTGMRVTVADVLLNKRNGVDVSIAPSEFYLACWIVPQRQMLIEAPPVIRENFDRETAMNGSSEESSGLHCGLSIRVPNSQFLVPYVEIAHGGKRVSNDSLVDLLVNSIGGNRTATLGRYFLTAAYLMFDHDANTFTLWQANPSPGRPNLVPVIEQSTDQSCATTSSGQGGGGDMINTPSISATADPPLSISTGAVVGIAVGSVAGLAAVAVAVAVAVFLILCRRRKKPVVRAGDQRVESLDNSADERARPDVLTEMPDDSPTPEMVGTDLYPEMDGSTLHLGGPRESGPQQSSHAAGRPVYELGGYGRAS
ncbi:hypothetical protein LA080_007072 [Diaporthe eres]|nr:hypothetical protein LA080_007072 [Diaporthe eres]